MTTFHSHRAQPTVRRALGTRMRALRKDLGLSQEVLGDRAGLSGKFIGEVERCEKSISIDSLTRVARGLGVHIQDLVGAHRQAPTAAEQLYALALRKPPAKIAQVLRMARAALG